MVLLVVNTESVEAERQSIMLPQSKLPVLLQTIFLPMFSIFNVKQRKVARRFLPTREPWAPFHLPLLILLGNYVLLSSRTCDLSNRSTAFTFDRSGRMLTAVSGRYNNTVGYAFDSVGRKASESLTIASQTYTVGSEFNARNELVKYTYLGWNGLR
jgi:hypothetical protein